MADYSLIPDYAYRDAIINCFGHLRLTQHASGYNFRCPVCMDSSDNPLDTNAWVLTNKGKYHCYCFKGRCTLNTSLINYLYVNNRSEYDRLIFSTLGIENGNKRKSKSIPKIKSVVTAGGIGAFDDGELISIMDDNPLCNRARRIVENRSIPFIVYQSWFVAKYDVKFSTKNGGRGNRYGNRIIIPFYKLGGGWDYFLARDMKKDSTLRYLKPPVDKEIYNLDWFDTSRKCFVTEGEIDSCFIDNCVSIGGTGGVPQLFKSKPELKGKYKRNLVFIWDNDEAGRLMCTKTSAKGYSYFNWDMVEVDDAFVGKDIKDINDIVKYGKDVTLDVNGRLSMSYLTKRIVKPTLGIEVSFMLDELIKNPVRK